MPTPWGETGASKGPAERSARSSGRGSGRRSGRVARPADLFEREGDLLDQVRAQRDARWVVASRSSSGWATLRVGHVGLPAAADGPLPPPARPQAASAAHSTPGGRQPAGPNDPSCAPSQGAGLPPARRALGGLDEHRCKTAGGRGSPGAPGRRSSSPPCDHVLRAARARGSRCLRRRACRSPARRRASLPCAGGSRARGRPQG